ALLTTTTPSLGVPARHRPTGRWAAPTSGASHACGRLHPTMRLAVAAAALVFTAPLTLALLGGGSGSSPAAPVAPCWSTGAILATTRALETGENYQARAAGSTASGAYAMIDSVWQYWSARAGQGTMWSNAWQAPPAVQDEVAAALLADDLTTYG